MRAASSRASDARLSRGAAPVVSARGPARDPGTGRRLVQGVSMRVEVWWTCTMGRLSSKPQWSETIRRRPCCGCVTSWQRPGAGDAVGDLLDALYQFGLLGRHVLAVADARCRGIRCGCSRGRWPGSRRAGRARCAGSSRGPGAARGGRPPPGAGPPGGCPPVSWTLMLCTAMRGRAATARAALGHALALVLAGVGVDDHVGAGGHGLHAAPPRPRPRRGCARRRGCGPRRRSCRRRGVAPERRTRTWPTPSTPSAPAAAAAICDRGCRRGRGPAGRPRCACPDRR